MTPAEREIIVQDGDELKIRCKGEGKLHFSTQMYAENVHILISLSTSTTAIDELLWSPLVYQVN